MLSVCLILHLFTDSGCLQRAICVGLKCLSMYSFSLVLFQTHDNMCFPVSWCLFFSSKLLFSRLLHSFLSFLKCIYIFLIFTRILENILVFSKYLITFHCLTSLICSSQHDSYVTC